MTAGLSRPGAGAGMPFEPAEPVVVVPAMAAMLLARGCDGVVVPEAEPAAGLVAGPAGVDGAFAAVVARAGAPEPGAVVVAAVVDAAVIVEDALAEHAADENVVAELAGFAGLVEAAEPVVAVAVQADCVGPVGVVAPADPDDVEGPAEVAGPADAGPADAEPVGLAERAGVAQ